MRYFLSIILCLLLSFSASAYEPAIRDINIRCRLDSLGSAHITEVWDVTATSGTEWYLVKSNLYDIEILDLEVKEGGKPFVNEGIWDLDRTREEKARKCGLNPVSGGYEICWGVGDYGDHVFTVSYTLKGAVKSLEDYDMLHLQFISDELSSNPEHASIVVEMPGFELDTTNTRIWGFGYDGTVVFHDGKVLAETDSKLRYHDSMILLMRLDKGVVASPQSTRHTTFQKVLDDALKGSDYSSKKSWFNVIMGYLVGFFTIFIYGGWMILMLPVLIIQEARTRKEYLGGVKKKDILWSRDVPFDGDLLVTNYALNKVGEGTVRNTLASAMILRMIQAGALIVRPDLKSGHDKIELAFGDKRNLDGMDDSAKELWRMMLKASGSDQILQDKEFSIWSEKHTEEVASWVGHCISNGEYGLKRGPWMTSSKINPTGTEQVRRAVGFKKFLVDYTLIKERASSDVQLWQEYLVFGALFGVADKVAKELKDINPTAFEQMTKQSRTVSPAQMNHVVNMSNNLARAITAAKSAQAAKHASSSGHGGHSSHGGGGGFSGGGHGGGSR